METYRKGFITKSFHSASSPLLFKKKKSLVADQDHDRRHLQSSSGAVKKGRRGQEPPPWGVMCLAALGLLRAVLLELTFRGILETEKKCLQPLLPESALVEAQKVWD